MTYIFINKCTKRQNPLKSQIEQNPNNTQKTENYSVYQIFKIDAELEITQNSIAKLEKLLQSKFRSLDLKPKGEIISIFHRSNILSPWSSKAIEIINNCNLTEVISIEKGLIYEFKKNSQFYRKILKKPSLVFDSMTQICITNQDLLTEYIYKRSSDSQSSDTQYLSLNKPCWHIKLNLEQVVVKLLLYQHHNYPHTLIVHQLTHTI